MLSGKLLQPSSSLPLCVDLDGTLIANDTTWAAVRLYVRRHCWQAPLLLWWLRRGRAYCKQQLASRVVLDVQGLPYHTAVLQLIETHKARGGKAYLVTATDASIAQQVCEHLGIFAGYYASDGVCNLRHMAKAARLCEVFGVQQFIYVGNSRDDLAVWRQAHSAVVVSNDRRLIKAARRSSNVVEVIAAVPQNGGNEN